MAVRSDGDMGREFSTVIMQRRVTHVGSIISINIITGAFNIIRSSSCSCCSGSSSSSSSSSRGSLRKIDTTFTVSAFDTVTILSKAIGVDRWSGE